MSRAFTSPTCVTPVRLSKQVRSITGYLIWKKLSPSMIMIFSQACLACITHAALHPGCKINTCPRSQVLTSLCIYAIFSYAIKTLVTSLTYCCLMAHDQPPLITDYSCGIYKVNIKHSHYTSIISHNSVYIT